MAMAMDQDEPQTYKHYCRVCKRGFGCGRALGGHMRAHGINDDYGNGDQDEDPSSSSAWADENPPSNKRMYALRANPSRLKSCRVCENCGKEFVSWKSFLEHGRCSSDDEDEPDNGDECYVSSPTSDAEEEGQFGNWSKRKRTRRTKSVVVPASSEEEDLANCLMLLSSARVEHTMPVFEPEESSCASASKTPILLQVPSPLPKGMFECKACKKVFTSHQALGGHRASHKKVKGCFAAKLDDLDEIPPQEEEIVTMNDNSLISAAAVMTMAIVPFNNMPLAVTPLNNKKSKIHECSICHRQFASGQALGGHKRCHWITSSSTNNNISCSSSNLMDKAPKPQQNVNNENQNRHNVLTLRPMIIDLPSSERLDLNLPASKEIRSPLRLDLQPSWVDHRNISNKDITSNGNENNNNNENNNSEDNNNKINERVNNNETLNNVDDEADSKVKLAKLSELKDMSEGGEVNWLQVGIGSSGNVNDGSE